VCFNILNVFRFLGVDIAGDIEVVLVFLNLIVFDKSGKFRDFNLITPRVDIGSIIIATVLSDMDAEIGVLEQSKASSVYPPTFSTAMAVCSLIEGIGNGRLAKYRQLKEGMMQVLLTGKIRLPH
jgi:hypothetical protein